MIFGNEVFSIVYAVIYSTNELTDVDQIWYVGLFWPDLDNSKSRYTYLNTKRKHKLLYSKKSAVMLIIKKKINKIISIYVN